jgi:hypothetical protein
MAILPSGVLSLYMQHAIIEINIGVLTTDPLCVHCVQGYTVLVYIISPQQNI